MKQLFLIFNCLLFIASIMGQSSYRAIKENGNGKVKIGYRLNSLVSDQEKNVENLIEYEILNLFFDFVEKKDKVEISREFIKAKSFSNLIRSIKKNQNYDFAFCFISKTNERMKEMRFSEVYLPDIEVMISNNNLPILVDSNDFLKRFSNATAVYVPGSTFEEDINDLELIKPNLSKLSVISSGHTIDKIRTCDSCFGFIELHQYFNNVKDITTIKRQNLFIKKREGYGFIFPLQSDWQPIVNEFFQDSISLTKIRKVIDNKLGKEMIDFINALEISDVENMSTFLLTKEMDTEKDKTFEAELLYENEKADNKKSKQGQEELKKYLFILVFSFVLIFITVFIAYRQKLKHNKIVVLKNEQLNIQKTIVEVKHKEIKDSINYAKRIQNALLQPEEYNDVTLPDHFIFFEPKDVVSGDFYWSKTFDKHYYLSVTDCTGHGVPGGFMSVLGIAMFNEIIRTKKNILPSDMLDALRDKIILELDQTSESGSNKDGMNTAVVKVNRETLMMNYAGAYHSIIIIREGELIELKTDKQPIGFTYTMVPFINYTFQLFKGDIVYLYSDGYPDQFGGEKGKKFMSKQLKSLLLSISSKPLKHQKTILASRFKEWKGNEEQVDDVTILGITL